LGKAIYIFKWPPFAKRDTFLFHPVAARVEVILNGDGRQVLYFLKNILILYSLGHL
jgi:hypothetical protein